MNGHVIVVDLGYGDAGKGTIVDWLCASSADSAQGRQVQAVVRFSGGAQAAHNVMTRDGRHHTFAQFGSGTFTTGTRTFLSRYMIVDPLALVAEAEHLARCGVPDPLSLVAIDRDALLTTPYHRAANQVREHARGASRHGSCGLGIGETARYALESPGDAPRAADMTTPRALARKLALLRDWLAADLAAEFAGQPGFPAILGAAGFPGAPDVDPPECLPSTEGVAAVYREVAARVSLVGDGYLSALLKTAPVVFEGAQGVLLDEWHGFHPYTTWSTTTFQNAETLLAEARETATRLGVTRTYQTRHGPGPFPTEDPTLRLPEHHNADGRWQGPVRQGHLDAVTLTYANEAAGGVDAVAVTHLDTARDHPELRIARRYDLGGYGGVPREGLDACPIRGRFLRSRAVFAIGRVSGGRSISRIEQGQPRDLAYQEELTRMLTKAVPVYDDPAPSTEAEWRDQIEGILHAPVTVLSHGPAVTDKTMRPLEAVSR